MRRLRNRGVCRIGGRPSVHEGDNQIGLYKLKGGLQCCLVFEGMPHPDTLWSKNKERSERVGSTGVQLNLDVVYAGTPTAVVEVCQDNRLHWTRRNKTAPEASKAKKPATMPMFTDLLCWQGPLLRFFASRVHECKYNTKVVRSLTIVIRQWNIFR